MYATVLFALVVGASGYTYYEPKELKPCPTVKPIADIKIQKLQGMWHMSLLILDSATEDIEESEVCINGMVFVNNSTSMKQTWNIYSPLNQGGPAGVVEVNVNVTPEAWTLETPLGSTITAVPFGYTSDMIMVAHCGVQFDQNVHLWTATATRAGILTPQMRLDISSILLDNGYDPASTKLITWKKC